MSNIQALQDIIEGGGIEVFDKLKLRCWEGGSFSIRVGLRINLKFSAGHTVEKRQAFLAAVRSYHREFGPFLTHFKANEATRKRKLVELPPLDEDMLNPDAEEHFSFHIYGFDPSAKVSEEPALFAAGGLCEGRSQVETNSDFTAHIPVSWAVEHGFDRVRDLVVEWSGLLRARHGIGGLSLLVDPPADQYVKAGYFLLQKFPGLDYEDEAIFNVEVIFSDRHPLDRIRTVNWLTVLDDGIVAELGGRDRIASALGPDCPVFGYDGGVVVQAGPQPDLGSFEDGRMPEFYRRVARLTKPVRFESYRRGLFRRLDEPLDGLAETMKWVRRFD